MFLHRKLQNKVVSDWGVIFPFYVTAHECTIPAVLLIGYLKLLTQWVFFGGGGKRKKLIAIRANLQDHRKITI